MGWVLAEGPTFTEEQVALILALLLAVLLVTLAVLATIALGGVATIRLAQGRPPVARPPKAGLALAVVGSLGVGFVTQVWEVSFVAAYLLGLLVGLVERPQPPASPPDGP